MKRHIRFSEDENILVLLDQRYLPGKEEWFVCRNLRDVVFAIKNMVIRGAPAIGVVAAYGCYLGTINLVSEDLEWRELLRKKLIDLEEARPTAVNLKHVVNIMRDIWESDPEIELEELRWIWLKKAKEIHNEDILVNKAIGKHGVKLLQGKRYIMTYCNAGGLATGGYGTALGIVRAAKSSGMDIEVIANETRPFLQGARLTAYELNHDDIKVRVICDNSAGMLMAKKMVDVVIVGADRIVLNGDTANKIGTYSLAVLAKYHNIPFYVAAPISTFDVELKRGEEIPIEQRPAREVTHIRDIQIVPEGVDVYNFAFDVTPGELITAIVCEKGIIYPPYEKNIPAVILGT